MDLLAGSGIPKPLVARSAGATPQYALRDRGWTYVLDQEDGTEQLFESASDPGEVRDRSGDAPLRAAYLRQAFRRWKLTTFPDSALEAEPEVSLTSGQREQLRLLGYLD